MSESLEGRYLLSSTDLGPVDRSTLATGAEYSTDVASSPISTRSFVATSLYEDKFTLITSPNWDAYRKTQALRTVLPGELSCKANPSHILYAKAQGNKHLLSKFLHANSYQLRLYVPLNAKSGRA